MKKIVKKRKLKVSGMTCEGCSERIEAALSKIDGIESVRIKRLGKVYIEYDLMKVPLKRIEDEITDLGYGLSSAIWNKMKRYWFHYSEETEYENMNLPEPPCCSDPPKTRKTL